VNQNTITAYQDMRAAHRFGGNAAIIPPLPYKQIPSWLREVWNEAQLILQQSRTWVICGYSLPSYDVEVRRLLRDSGVHRNLRIFLLSPDSKELQTTLQDILPDSSIIPLSGLPAGSHELEAHLVEE
jgi:hypothetical protein